MARKRRWPVLLLVTMSLVGISFGIWLIRLGELLLGSVWFGVWLFNAQRFAMWLVAPVAGPSVEQRPIWSRYQRVLFAIVCLLGAAVSAVGVYLWYLWPEQWQAGLVFILFGLIVLGPVTVTEVRFRKGLAASRQPPRAN